MRNKLLLIGLVFLAACNNSGEKKEKTEDTAVVTSHDGGHQAITPGSIPPLPAVPVGAKVFFKNLKNDASITMPFKLEMGSEIIKIDTAGPIVAGSGHHHLLINGPDSLASGETIPKDSLNIHFGRGQTDYELNLPPGKYKLTLQMADGAHRSYGSRMAATVSITVKK
jgi:Domain of unknown function (DUF4399)